MTNTRNCLAYFIFCIKLFSTDNKLYLEYKYGIQRIQEYREYSLLESLINTGVCKYVLEKPNRETDLDKTHRTPQ